MGDRLEGGPDFQRQLRQKMKRQKRLDDKGKFKPKRYRAGADLAPGEHDEPTEVVQTDTEEVLDFVLDVAPEMDTPFARAILRSLSDERIMSSKVALNQHFLINEAAINCLVESTEIVSGDSVLEIGPGPGNITSKLATACQKVGARLTTIELDKRFENILRQIQERDVVSLEWGDAIQEFPGLTSAYGINKVVGNIPYAILEPLLTAIYVRARIKTVVLVTGKRYAQRAVVDVKDEDVEGDLFSKTSLFSQARFKPEIVMPVSRNSFHPTTSVESAIVKMTERKGMNADFTMLADAIVKGGRRPIRDFLQSLIGSKHKKVALKKFVGLSVDAASELAQETIPTVGDFGLSDEILNTRVATITNEQMRRLLNKMDWYRKKTRSEIIALDDDE